MLARCLTNEKREGSDWFSKPQIVPKLNAFGLSLLLLPSLHGISLAKINRMSPGWPNSGVCSVSRKGRFPCMCYGVCLVVIYSN